MRVFVNEFCGHPFQMQLSRELARRGHAVCHTYFADNTSTPKGSDAIGGSLPNLSMEGLRIRRSFAKYGLLSRRAADIEYGEAVASRLREFAPDVAISANMPLDGQRILLKASRAAGARFVYWLQDIYSTAVRFVLSRKSPLLAGMGAWYYERLECRLLKRSDAVVCIAPAFAERLAQWGIDRAPVTVIPNWAPLDEMVPAAKDNPWAREHGVADRFCFVYSGTLGMKHRPQLLLELAKEIEKRGDARLLVIAGGAGAEWLAERVYEVGGGALQMLPYQPYARVPEVLGAADVLIALLDSEAGAFAVPSKTLAYLCAGRPLLLAAPQTNEAARVVLEADAGMVISPDRPEQLLAAAALLQSDGQLRERYGNHARSYAERHFGIEAIADRFLEVLSGKAAGESMAGQKPAETTAQTAA